MSILLKAFREGVGRLIVFGSYLSLPTPIQRTKQQQEAVNKQCESLSIYQFYACPFCVKVRRSVHRLGLNINYVNAQDSSTKSLLKEQGGKAQVPCLCIHKDGKTTWLYESNAIITYLEKQFVE